MVADDCVSRSAGLRRGKLRWLDVINGNEEAFLILARASRLWMDQNG